MMVSLESSGDFGEDRILRAESAVIARQAVRGRGIQRRLAVAIQVAQRHENLQRLVLHCLAAEPEQRLQHVVGLFPAGRRLGSA